jgi:hypothetical protein
MASNSKLRQVIDVMANNNNPEAVKFNMTNNTPFVDEETVKRLYTQQKQNLDEEFAKFLIINKYNEEVKNNFKAKLLTCLETIPGYNIENVSINMFSHLMYVMFAGIMTPSDTISSLCTFIITPDFTNINDINVITKYMKATNETEQILLPCFLSALRNAQPIGGKRNKSNRNKKRQSKSKRKKQRRNKRRTMRK